jgi:hypothetical protein
MSTRTTELVARVVGDTKDVSAKLQLVRNETVQLGAAAEAANQRAAKATDDAAAATRRAEAAAKSAAAAHERASNEFARNSEKTMRGVAGVLQAFYALEAQGSARVIALAGTVGNLAEFLGPTGKVVSGVSIVTATIVALFMQAKEKSAAATKAMLDDVRKMASAGDLAGLNRLQTSLYSGNRLFESDRYDKAIVEAVNSGGLQKVRKDIEALNKALTETPPKLEEGGLAMERFNKRRAGNETKRQEALALERALLKVYQETSGELDLLTQQTVGRDATMNKYRAGENAAKDEAKAWKDLVADVKRVGEQIDKVMRDFTLNQDIARDRTRQELDDEATAREKGLVALRAENDALATSAAAHEDLLLTRMKGAAVAAAVEKATKVGIILSEQEKDKIAQQVAESERLLKVRKALVLMQDLRLDTLFDIPASFDGIGNVADAAAQMAAASAAVAGHFGEAGDHLARMLTQSAQLLGNLSQMQRAGIFSRQEVDPSDPAGKRMIDVQHNVGFLGALQGKAGLAGVTSAVTATMGFAAAVGGIADTLDIFGDRAREQRRILRERAIAFNAAIEEFAIVQRTSLQDQLRQNLANAAQVAAQAGFANPGFQSADDIDAIGASLRELATKTPVKEVATNLRNAAAQLDKLSATARSNEEKLREANQSALGRLNEDLAVRRTALELGKAEGDAARNRLEFERELQGYRDRFGDAADEYIASLTAIVEAEQKAAAATARRAAVMQQLEDDDTFLGGDANKRLQRRVGAMVQLFDESIWSAFDGIDFSTAEGLKAARKIVEGIYATMSADGVISEQERQVLDFLKGFVGDVDNALAALPEVLDPIAVKLERFSDRVRLFGMSAAEQFDELKKIFSDMPFAGSLVGDINTDAGRQNLKDTIQAQIAALLSNDSLDGEQQKYLDALEQFLGIINAAIAEAAEEVSSQTAQARADRDGRRSWTANRNELFGIEGRDALITTMQSFGAVFTELSKEFDMSSVAGLEAAQSHLRAIYDSLVGMSDEAIMERFGMTKDEVVQALLATNNGLGALIASLLQTGEAAEAAAAATADFTDRVFEDYLRSSGQDQQADLNAAKKKRDDALQKAEEMELGADIIKRINDTYANEVRRINERYAAATAQVERAASSSAGATGTAGGRPSVDSDTVTRPKTRNTTVVGDFMTASELTAQSMSGILADIRYNTGSEGAVAGILRSLGGAPSLSSLSFPAFPTRTMGSGEGVTFIVQGGISVTIAALNPEGRTADEAGRAVVAAVMREFGAEVRTTARRRGDAKRGGLST